MTTQILTSNTAHPASSPLDEVTLSQLATAFFSALPGTSPAGGSAAPQLHAANQPLPAVQQSLPDKPIHLPAKDASVPSVPLTEDRVTARSSGLPGSETLAALALSPEVSQFAGFSPLQPSGKIDFYFLNLASELAAAPQPPHLAAATPALDVHTIRRDFPILSERVNGKPLIWLDNAATTHKPQTVIDRLAWFYAHENSNIHRAAHELAARATDAYEKARQTVADFLGAASADEIIFVRGATEGINLVAKSWGKQHLRAGDEVLVSQVEHHANIVPWQQLAQETGAVLKVIPVDDSGQVVLEDYYRLLSPRTRLVSVTQVSNALGTILPVKAIIDAAHAVGARVLVDGAQSVSHIPVNLQQLDADFFVFSGHKIFGPTGIGVVYGKQDLLNATQPWQGGGNMIADVTFERTLYHPAPARFEAGTGNIADAVGLGAALEYVQGIGLERIAAYEHQLLDYATNALRQIPGLRLIGTAAEKTSVLSFVLEGHTTESVGKALSNEGIAVRSGHHCAQPALRRFGVETSVRPSLAFYNTHEEIDTLVRVVRGL